MLDPDEAEQRCQELLDMRAKDCERLDILHDYWMGRQSLPVIPTAVPAEVRRMAEMSRINVCGLVVNVPAQSSFITSIRDDGAKDNHPIWDTWQANKLDSRQSALYRASLAFGLSYMLVMPGDPGPTMVGKSPRQMTTAWSSDPDWPEFALEVITTRDGSIYLLYDDEYVYTLTEVPTTGDVGEGKTRAAYKSEEAHGAGVCPVVRFSNLEDLEFIPHSEIQAIMPLQDQLDLTMFDMLVAQHYGAFRQRYILGWTSADETAKAKAAASRLWTFADDDKTITVGEFSQTDLSGYLKSRSAAIESVGLVAQMPPYNLVGQMVNLSADAIAAAEVGANRRNDDRHTTWGESAEQALRLAAKYQKMTLSDNAQVTWKETEARSLSQTVDALGKAVQMLEVPPEATWPHLAIFSQQDFDSWKQQAGTAQVEAMLARLNPSQPAAVPPSGTVQPAAA